MSECLDGKESQDSFLPIRLQDTYVALHDAYNGVGGFSPLVAPDRNMFGRQMWQRAGGGNSRGAYCYLVPEPSEQRYITRAMMTVYYNYFAPIINCRVDPVFTRLSPRTVVKIGEREQERHHYSDWCADVTGNGISKTALLMSALRSATQNLVSFLVMDMGQDKKPYLYTQEAGDVDRELLQVDSRGHISQIAFVGVSREDREYFERITWTAQTVKKEKRSVTASTDAWELVSEEDNRFGLIPVLPIFSEARMDTWEYLPFPATSYGLMMACYSLYEGWSSYEWLKHTQGHSRLVFFNADIDAIASDGRTNATVIQNPTAESSANASYISPDSAHMANALEALKYKVEELMRLANEVGVNVAQSSNQAESGIAKAFTFSARNDVLMRTRSVAVACDEWIMSMYKHLTNGGDWEAYTTYADSFLPNIPPDERETMDIASWCRSNGLPLMYREVVKQLAGKLFAGDRATMQAISDEIDTAQATDDMMYEDDDE